MQDVSQSGYDLALACFGVRNALNDQKIIDLIIHNRRIHGAKQSTSFGHYRRAISKARNGTGQHMAGDDPTVPTPVCPPLSSGISGASAESTITGGAADPNEKPKLCERISAIIGVQIVRIVKLDGQEPVFLMEFERVAASSFPTSAS